jgi:hypothetical protein
MTVRHFLLPAALLFVVAAAHAQRGAPSLTGAWNAETDTGNGKTESKLLLKVDGDKLTGTLKTSYGDFAIQDGSVEGADVFFNVVIRRDSYELKTTYRGHVFGEEIQFRVEAGERTLLTIAKRAPAPAPAAKEK